MTDSFLLERLIHRPLFREMAPGRGFLMTSMLLSAVLVATSYCAVLENQPVEIPSTDSETKRNVWTVLDNGLEFALLPIVSMLPPSQQKVTVITFFNAGAHNDPGGKSGRTKLAAHLFALSRAGDRSSRSYQQWQDYHEGQAQLRAGSQHTWIIESVPPGQLLDTIEELRNRFAKLEVTTDDLDRTRKYLRKNKRTGKWGDSDQLANKVLDRLDPLASGPRDRDDWNTFDLEEIRKFLANSFQPVNARIAIVGPFDPRPILEAIQVKLGPIAGGKKLTRPPVPVPIHGVVKPFSSTDPSRGLIMKGWRVPAPGTVEALALGLFVPRVQRSLQQGHGDCSWDPFLNPEVVLIKQEVFGKEPFQPKDLEEAISRVDATIEFAITAPLEGGDFEWARKSIGIHLGAYRVHEEVSMVSPLPVAEAVLLRRVFNMDEPELQNNFGRDQALLRLRENYLTDKKSVSGSVIPKRITEGSNSIRSESR